MEPWIPLIIMAVISLLFKGKKEETTDQKKREPEKAKPFTAQPQSSDPFRKLKEMSQEMYKELQREFQNPPDEPPSRQTPPDTPRRAEAGSARTQPAATAVRPMQAPKPAKPVASAEAKELEKREEHRGRLTAHGSRKTQDPYAAEPEHMIPKSEQDLLKGIIFSEILGPPKAKR
ncbi:type IV secretory pathway VirB10-like protein [Sporosarcina luteola]|nr:type IV secretory pathway VirB10-like protein [Sporosarcina luteola]